MRLVLTSEDNNTTSVACEGEICALSFPANVDNPLEELLGTTCYNRHVVFDLGNASFIDSSGVCWIMACHKRFLSSGGQMILHSVPPMIDQVLRLLHLHTLLTIKSDRAAALAMVEEGQAKA